MKTIILKVTLLFIFLFLYSCSKNKPPSLQNVDVSKVISKMSDIMVHDVTNPPLAARFFAYSCLAGYEIAAQNDKSFKSFHGVLHNYPDIKKPTRTKTFDARLSTILAIMKTAEKLQPSGNLMIAYEKQFLDSCRRLGFSDEVIDSSGDYASAVSKQILAYAKGDSYNKISNYSRYKLKQAPGMWEPTPPAYLPSVEPYFHTIRTFTLDSVSQFSPPLPIPFSSEKKSSFFKLMQMNYYKKGSLLDQSEKNIANFWDCNPFAVQNQGHMLIGLKKISPGAHWMGIAGIAAKKANAGFYQSVQVYTVLSIGLMDAFASCWDIKYKTNRIRPETVIRKYIDPSWKPFLQTPPFPEYTSGHSVISATASIILTHYFGDNFEYTDDVEIPFGIPKRNFRSFDAAAREAAISRFYGGIHFMDAVQNGLKQGENIGEWVLKKTN